SGDFTFCAGHDRKREFSVFLNMELCLCLCRELLIFQSLCTAPLVSADPLSEPFLYSPFAENYCFRSNQCNQQLTCPIHAAANMTATA
ncbi:MAG: hypothetical protein WCP20_15450, partial [Desulfuromonadales bacterium]